MKFVFIFNVSIGMNEERPFYLRVGSHRKDFEVIDLFYRLLRVPQVCRGI
jgi:hypothetical protein